MLSPEQGQIKFLSLLFEHLVEEKIEYATSFQPKTSPPIKEPLKEPVKHHVEKLKIEPNSQTNEKINIKGIIMKETDNGVLLKMGSIEEWLPKSRIYSKYNPKDNTSLQTITTEAWILEKKTKQAS